MSAELGRIEKPEAASVIAERKLYLVPLIVTSKETPAEYNEKVERYWIGVREHVNHLETRMGGVNRIYHESVPFGGDEGLKLIERISPKSHDLAKQKVAEGASLEAVEDEELLAEMMDWQRCLMVGLMSKKVSDEVWGKYNEAMTARNEHLPKRMSETLQPGEAGILFISENHHLQFPADIQVFYVAPPALDEIHRWMRDQATKAPRQETQQEETGEQPAPGD